MFLTAKYLPTFRRRVVPRLLHEALLTLIDTVKNAIPFSEKVLNCFSIEEPNRNKTYII